MKTPKRPELDELFHQPIRLEIMAELCSTADGCSFISLREKCDLSDGNLSRHLQALAQASAIKIQKSFIKSKPHTSVTATKRGRESFLNYLDNLEQVLHHALDRAKKSEVEHLKSLPGAKRAAE